MRTAVTSFCLTLLLAVAAACSHDSGPSAANQQIFEITDVTAKPTVITCPNVLIIDGAPTVAAPVYANLQMINTTADSVAVTKVGSSGVIIRSAGAPSLISQAVYTTGSLSFSQATLRPHDGVATVTVILPTPCPSGVHIPEHSTVDVYVTFYVTTTIGQFATTPLTITFNYPNGG